MRAFPTEYFQKTNFNMTKLLTKLLHSMLYDFKTANLTVQRCINHHKMHAEGK